MRGMGVAARSLCVATRSRNVYARCLSVPFARCEFISCVGVSVKEAWVGVSVKENLSSTVQVFDISDFQAHPRAHAADAGPNSTATHSLGSLCDSSNLARLGGMHPSCVLVWGKLVSGPVWAPWDDVLVVAGSSRPVCCVQALHDGSPLSRHTAMETSVRCACALSFITGFSSLPPPSVILCA